MRVPDELRNLRSPDTVRIEGEIGFNIADLREFGSEKFLFLCFTNRCGSTYFAQLLYSTGRLAYAGEFLSHPAVLERARAEELRSFEHYLSTLPATQNWIASKINLPTLTLLAESGILDRIGQQSCFILLERQDKLAQAISRFIAFATDRWTSLDTKNAGVRYPDYSRAEIDAHLQAITMETYGFYAFFAANNITPLHLSYEDVVRNPQESVQAAGRYLGMANLHARPDRIDLRRQSSPMNQVWKNRYLEGR